MSRVDKALAWMQARLGKVTYSMENRNGPSSYDCSSAVYYALIEAGFLPKGSWIGNTDSLFNDLEKNGWTQLHPDAQGNVSVKRGDVFIWGKRGASGGSFGHTGFVLDAPGVGRETIIHCNYAHNGISVQNHDQFWVQAGEPEYTFYRPPADPAPAAPAAAAAPVAQAAPAAAPVQGSITKEDIYAESKRAFQDVLREALKK